MLKGSFLKNKRQASVFSPFSYKTRILIKNTQLKKVTFELDFLIQIRTWIHSSYY